MITVYWGINPDVTIEGLRADPPVPIMNKLFKDRIPRNQPWSPEINYNRCPATIDALDNIYGIKSIFDYSIKIDFKTGHLQTGGPKEAATEWDENFFHTHATIRSVPGNLFSFTEGLAFLSEAPTLRMTQLPAYMEDNNIAKNTICVPGEMDIGKYFRILEFAWHFRKGHDKIEFSRDHITYYVQFHTKEKIKFQRFLWTKELSDLANYINATRARKKVDTVSKFKRNALNYYYNIFDKYNLKNKMLKIINENLCKDEDIEGNVI